MTTHCQRGEQRGRFRHSRRRSVRPHKVVPSRVQVQLRAGVKPREVELQPLLPFFSYVELVKSRMNDKRAVPRQTYRKEDCHTYL